MRVSTGSRGKGSRRLPGRDGGARRQEAGEHWRIHVPSAVQRELGLQHPTHEFRFRIYSAELATALGGLDASLARLGISYHIKSLGRSTILMGLIRTARFRLLVPEVAAGRVAEVLRQVGAA